MNSALIGGSSQVLGETLSSLYPILVKTTSLTVPLQVFIRIVVYCVISLFFINVKQLFQNVKIYHWILAGLITYTHIWSSYQGFQTLEAGLSMTILYTYPILILIFYRMFFGKFIPTYKYFLFLIPLFFIYNLFQEKDKEEHKPYNWKGIGYMVISALTEALTYIYLKYFEVELSILNSWNSIFFSYFGSFLLSMFTLRRGDLFPISLPQMSYVTIANAVIGLVGLVCRFYAIPRVSPTIYSALSFIGIITSNVFGYFLLQEPLGIKKIFQLLGIVLSLVAIKVF